MKEILIDCTSGARKESLVDGLLSMLDPAEQDAFAERLCKIGIDGVAAHICREGASPRLIMTDDGLTEAEARKARGRRHEHRSLADVRYIIETLFIDGKAAQDAIGVYGLLAQAEARAHGTGVEEVHFHEVGNNFAIAYVVAFCMLVAQLDPDVVASSPITTGYGLVECAHGTLPVPAPATAFILDGLPTVRGEVEGELTTPTGAAIVRHFAF